MLQILLSHHFCHHVLLIQVFNVMCTRTHFLQSASAYQAVLVFQHFLSLLCLPFLHSCHPFLALQEDPSLLVLPCLPSLPYLLSPPCPPWLQDILVLLCLLYHPSLLYGMERVCCIPQFILNLHCMCACAESLRRIPPFLPG